MAETTHNRKVAALALAAMVAVQALLLVFSFKSADEMFSPEPIVNVDFSSQYYWAEAARAFHDQDNKMWGYDPFFMAGYPLDFVFNSSLPVQMAAVVFGDVPAGRVVKACFALSVLLVPFTLYFALRSFRLETLPALGAAALGVVYFWTGENSFFAHLGMIAGAFMLHFFLLPVAFLYRFFESSENRAVSVLIFLLPLSFMIHKTAFVLTGAPAVILLLIFWRRFSLVSLVLLGGIVLMTALFNLHWLYPFFKFLPLKIEDPATTYFQNTDLLRFLKDLAPIPPMQPFYSASLTRIFILAAGVIGLVRMRRDRNPLFAPLTALIGFFFALTYFGSLVPELRHLQPYRYLPAFYFMWLPAAAFGLRSLGERASGIKGGGVAARAALAAGLSLLMALPGFHHFSLAVKLTTELDKPSRELVEWTRDNTAPSARLLIEDINSWSPRPGDPALFGGARLVNLLPLLTGRELVGGPFPNAFIAHHHADFHDGRLFGKPVLEYGEIELEESLTLYNIGWVACWSGDAKRRFEAYPGARREAVIGGVSVYALDRGHDFFLVGSGQASAGFNRLDLSELVPENGLVVISYHYVEGLSADPPARLFRVDRGGDPAGFIGVENPPPRLSIRLGR